MEQEMKKEYQKPEVIVISLNAQEKIAGDGNMIDGDMDMESSIF